MKDNSQMAHAKFQKATTHQTKVAAKQTVRVANFILGLAGLFVFSNVWIIDSV